MALAQRLTARDLQTSDTQFIRRIPASTAKRPAFFRWREQWAVGIEALDRDHRSLSALINYLALRFGAGYQAATDKAVNPARHRNAPPALGFWLKALHRRAREHFDREDALMRATHYPNTVAHAGEHALLLAEFTAMMREIAARGDECLKLSDLEAMKQWFMGHTLDMDRRLGGYLREQGVTALCPRP